MIITSITMITIMTIMMMITGITIVIIISIAVIISTDHMPYHMPCPFHHKMNPCLQHALQHELIPAVELMPQEVI